MFSKVETNDTKPDWIRNFIRILFTTFDRIAFFLLGAAYEIFFNVASAELFTNATIKAFYGRMQLIVGVFMVFKLAVTILQGVVNPDTFTDKKSGFSSIITRIIFALVMLVLIVPINIPNAKTEYEIQLNNNGLLFGTLYSLQNRILSNNTLGRLVLGTDDGFTNTSASGDEQTHDEKLTETVNIFSSTILKGFVRINLKPEEERTQPPEGKSDEMLNENRMCEDIDDEVLNTYTSLDSTPGEILDNVNATCGSGKNKRYVFTYTGLLPTVVALVFAVILIGYTVDIAVRAVKLAVLRILAPIPIISYMHPSKDNGAFGAWVKTLTSTYIDVFVRLAVIYFVIFLIQDMIVNGIIINNGTGFIGILSAIFIWIGLFFFARQAPKFIRDVLGLKGHMSNIGLSGILGGTAMAMGGGGLRGFALGATQGAEAAIQGEASGKPVSLGQTWSQNRDMMAKIRTGDKDARGGFIGGMMDRMNYTTRERNARQLGIGNQDLADAKYLKDQREAMAAATKKELDFATEALNSLGSNASQQERISAQERYMQAYEKNERYQAAAAKAASTYEKMDKDRANLGVAPRISDRRDRKYTVRQRVNNTFGTNFATSEQESADRWNDRLGTHFTAGTYRTPLAVTNDIPNYDADNLPATPEGNDSLIGGIEGHKRDVKNFNGTTDDSTFGSSGHGSGNGGRS